MSKVEHDDYTLTVAWWEESNVRPSMILMLISLILFEQLNILCKFATVIKNQDSND